MTHEPMTEGRRRKKRGRRDWVKNAIIAFLAVLLVLTRWVKATKGLHPILFILASALVGVVFSF